MKQKALEKQIKESTELPNEEELKKVRKNLKNYSRKIAKEEIVDETAGQLVPFEEPEAPDTNDFESNQDEEYALWVDREVERIRKEKNNDAWTQYEIAKTNQRKHMSSEQLIEIHQQNQKEKGHMKFYQKYYHKGAFSIDESEKAEELLNRDYLTPTGDDLLDKTALPKEMMVRGDDYNKRGKSKWTHLSNEDTTTVDYRRMQALLSGERPRKKDKEQHDQQN